MKDESHWLWAIVGFGVGVVFGVVVMVALAYLAISLYTGGPNGA
jgi:hypothetical protein